MCVDNEGEDFVNLFQELVCLYFSIQCCIEVITLSANELAWVPDADRLWLPRVN